MKKDTLSRYRFTPAYLLIDNVLRRLFEIPIELFTVPKLDASFSNLPFSSHAMQKLLREFKFNSILDIGPESENFFYLKPFLGIETTSDSAFYIISGIYLEDNIGSLFTGEDSNYILTPSFGIGYYDDGDGKKLGNNIEFRSTLEISYQLENKNRFGLSIGHISNANIADKNPGVEIISLSYQVPF